MPQEALFVIVFVYRKGRNAMFGEKGRFVKKLHNYFGGSILTIIWGRGSSITINVIRYVMFFPCLFFSLLVLSLFVLFVLVFLFFSAMLCYCLVCFVFLFLYFLVFSFLVCSVLLVSFLLFSFLFFSFHLFLGFPY